MPTPTHTSTRTVIPSPTPTHTYIRTIIPMPTPTHTYAHTIIPAPTPNRAGGLSTLISTKMGMKKMGEMILYI